MVISIKYKYIHILMENIIMFQDISNNSVLFKATIPNINKNNVNMLPIFEY